MVNRFPTLEQRRLVAILGSIDIFRPRLWLEALRQGVLKTEHVVWVSDGGRGFWNLFTTCFASLGIGILDFFSRCPKSLESCLCMALMDARKRHVSGLLDLAIN